MRMRCDDKINEWMHTTSFGGTSPRALLEKVVRSEMGYMGSWADRPSGEGGEREMEERAFRVGAKEDDDDFQKGKAGGRQNDLTLSLSTTPRQKSA